MIAVLVPVGSINCSSWSLRKVDQLFYFEFCTDYVYGTIGRIHSQWFFAVRCQFFIYKHLTNF